MKIKKIRGHKRLRKQIHQWIHHGLFINLDDLKKHKYYYHKIWIGPWRRLLLNSRFKEPKKQTRTELIKGLEQIYNAWDKELMKLNEPYYLKIWIFEPTFSQSQIVCAIGEKIEWYESLFGEMVSDSAIPNFSGKLIGNFNWKKYRNYEFSEAGSGNVYSVLKGNVFVGGF